MTSSARDVADLIERFIAGNVGDYEWDDFTSCPSESPLLENARLECAGAAEHYPAPAGSGRYCSDEGIALLRDIAARLRSAQ